MSALTRIQQRQFDTDPRPGIVVNSVHPGFVDTDMSSHQGHLTIDQGKIVYIYKLGVSVVVWLSLQVTMLTNNV